MLTVEPISNKFAEFLQNLRTTLYEEKILKFKKIVILPTLLPTLLDIIGNKEMIHEGTRKDTKARKIKQFV